MGEDKKLDDDIAEIKARYKTDAEELAEQEEQGEPDFSGYMLGLNLLVSILVCTGIGLLFDKFFDTGGLLIALFVAIGFAAGIWQMWKGFNR